MTQLDHHAYVPVLKVKQGEKLAMAHLDAAVVAKVTPLFEVVRRTDKPVSAHLDTAFKGFAGAVAPFESYFFDCREIEADGPSAAVDAFGRAAALGKPFIPVTSVSRTADVAAAMAHRVHGVAIRLSKDEFESGTLGSAVPSFLSAHGLTPSEVDLMVDLGAIDQMIMPGVAKLASLFLADVPHHAAWRSLILSACGFPRTIAGVGADDHGSFDRIDWRHWRDHMHLKRASLTRLPTYSDCGIQHRDGVEGIDFTKVRPSAAIRQTYGDTWYVEKGRNIRDHGGGQFQALASKVIGATHAVAAHCAGCTALHAASANPKGYSSLGKWREFGTVHHITTVMESLAMLP